MKKNKSRIAKLKSNNKGIAIQWIILTIIIVVLLFAVLVSKGAFASKQMTSLTPKDKSCSAKDIPISVKGTAYTKDDAFFGVIATPEKITIEEVRTGGTMLRAISNQDFTWSVKLYDDFTGNLVASDGGSNSHPGGSTRVEDKFTLNFFLPDNNCNGAIDDFEGVVIFSVTTDDDVFKEVKERISFKSGKLVRSNV